jgi:histidinol-phosphate/aromatic aminotransferase/cobyric acid decarboxylase-like protein
VLVLVNANNAAATLAGATSLRLTAQPTTVAGQPFAVTVTALDANGNPATGFTGTIALTAATQATAQPLSYTFTAADAGTHTFTNGLFLSTGGTQTVTVTPGAARLLAIAAPATASAGTPVAFTVPAYDAYHNVATDYAGTVIFSPKLGSIFSRNPC